MDAKVNVAELPKSAAPWCDIPIWRPRTVLLMATLLARGFRSQDPSLYNYTSPLFAEPLEVAMWNATVPNPFEAGQQDEFKDGFLAFPSDFQSYDSGFASASGNYQQSESSFDFKNSEASFDFSHPSGSLYDPFPTYAQTSTSNSDLAMPVGRRPARNILSHHSSSNAVPSVAQRRQSAQSVAASSIMRPSSTYTDTSFALHSGAMSPISAPGGHFFSSQETYPYEADEFLDFNAGYMSSSRPEDLSSNSLTSPEISVAGSPPPGSVEDNSGSSSHDDVPPRSHPLYNVVPSDDGYYHCPFAASENCGHEPKQLKCEYEYVLPSNGHRFLR
ncbi:hypothetical protein FKW77_004151 [Venturia effusa]|uniref:Uncharacterized protein n=1 Tax=Venturia effusa TaxID=50376 RepID=A0A517LK81_9PEZI|nr:hypothetical protein FKW77_004151 [Venturia effusa]